MSTLLTVAICQSRCQGQRPAQHSHLRNNPSVPQTRCRRPRLGPPSHHSRPDRAGAKSLGGRDQGASPGCTAGQRVGQELARAIHGCQRVCGAGRGGRRGYRAGRACGRVCGVIEGQRGGSQDCWRGTDPRYVYVSDIADNRLCQACRPGSHPCSLPAVHHRPVYRFEPACPSRASHSDFWPRTLARHRCDSAAPFAHVPRSAQGRLFRGPSQPHQQARAGQQW
jgi:hypothetical protein